MRYEITERSGDILQITLPDQRWYARRVMGQLDFVPSVTWITHYYPKGEGYARWLASHGWDEAEAIRVAAGEKGDKVHQAIAVLLRGGTVTMQDVFENPTTHEPEEIMAEEYYCVMTFQQWFAETKPEVIASEFTVWNEKYRYAGTVDLLCKIDDEWWLIDFKTSKEIWPSFEIQVSAYKHTPTIPKGCRLGILQVGYTRNKKKHWKFTHVPDRFPLFRNVYAIWKHETSGTMPLQRDYPMAISLNLPAEKVLDNHMETAYDGKEA